MSLDSTAPILACQPTVERRSQNPTPHTNPTPLGHTNMATSSEGTAVATELGAVASTTSPTSTKDRQSPEADRSQNPTQEKDSIAVAAGSVLKGLKGAKTLKTVVPDTCRKFVRIVAGNYGEGRRQESTQAKKSAPPTHDKALKAEGAGAAGEQTAVTSTSKRTSTGSKGHQSNAKHGSQSSTPDYHPVPTTNMNLPKSSDGAVVSKEQKDAPSITSPTIAEDLWSPAERSTDRFRSTGERRNTTSLTSSPVIVAFPHPVEHCKPHPGPEGTPVLPTHTSTPKSHAGAVEELRGISSAASPGIVEGHESLAEREEQVGLASDHQAIWRAHSNKGLFVGHISLPEHLIEPAGRVMKFAEMFFDTSTQCFSWANFKSRVLDINPILMTIERLKATSMADVRANCQAFVHEIIQHFPEPVTSAVSEPEIAITSILPKGKAGEVPCFDHSSDPHAEGAITYRLFTAVRNPHLTDDFYAVLVTVKFEKQPVDQDAWFGFPRANRGEYSASIDSATLVVSKDFTDS